MNGEAIVCAGGGLAAWRTAQALRDGGCDRPIVLVSDEPELPYDRPPLSKTFLLGTASEADIRLTDAATLDRLGIELRLSSSVGGIDRAGRCLLLKDGASIDYHTLVVATGARPLRLAALDGHPRAHVLRSLGDARQLRSCLASAASVVVAGGGLIGLEVASVARGQGAKVTVVEAAAAPLAAVLGVRLGRLVQHWHEGKGIEFRCATTITGCAPGHALQLSDGTALAASLVLVGIGTVANTEWLVGSGLELDRGLVVDDLGRTGDPHIFGVGDATSRRVADTVHPNRQWTRTSQMARRVAGAMLGKADQPALAEDNYFWSDQHGTRLQYAGVLAPDGEIETLAGHPSEEKFVVRAVRDGASLAVLGLGLPRDFLRHSAAL